MTHDPLDPENDPFGPPAVSTVVECLHCGQQYDSYRIEWRIEECADGKPHGFWCCPIPGCDGKGFGFDILPIDPNYRDEHGGWVHDDEDDEEELEEDEAESFEFGGELNFDEVPPDWSSPSGPQHRDAVGRDDDIPF
jgi:hypothetical protein